MNTTDPFARLMSQVVAIVAEEGEVGYPSNAPFDPPESYPELPYPVEPDRSNRVYPMVRNMLIRLGMDKEHIGSPNWNPFRGKVPEGGKVVIKPNWVLDVSRFDINALITHMAVLRPLIDYAWKACGPNGRIDILESPIQNTDWDHILELTQAQTTVDTLRARGVQITVQDIRTECFIEKDVVNFAGWRLKVFYRRPRPGTAHGYTVIDLAEQSLLEGVKEKSEKLRGIQSWTGKEARDAHQPGMHRYKIPNEILECDAFLNVPKLKTHRKAGVTLTLKNLVGMADKKDWLPHYVEGTPGEGGDEAPRKRDWHVRVLDNIAIIQFFRRFGFSLRPPGIEKHWRRKIEEDLFQLKNVRQGNWFGGDTVWRMVYDLNMILLHADAHGKLHQPIQRYYFGLLDGIVAGEKFGPLDSMPKRAGVLVGGEDPIRVEYIGTLLMGFDAERIKTLTNVGQVPLSFGSMAYRDTRVVSNNPAWDGAPEKVAVSSFHFIPPPGWQGHVEQSSESISAAGEG